MIAMTSARDPQRTGRAWTRRIGAGRLPLVCLIALTLTGGNAALAGAAIGSSQTSTSQPAAPAPSARLNGAGLEAAGASLAGTGSSFAAPAIETFVNTVTNAPYSLNINYTSSSSGQGRFEFTNETTDFAVSDIGYVGNTDTTPPSFPFNFIPITAGGIAFMYNIPGLSKNLQLSSRTACALLTGGIKNWNDPNIAADNPGVSLPNLAVQPVTESDSAGTNYVLEEWCIDEQPAIWAAFVTAQESQSGGVTDQVALSATSPNSNWPGIQGGLDTQATTTVAGDVATSPGAIGAVQVKYATDLPGFSGSDPSKGVALVKNASGAYTSPKDPVDVASALAYATQQANGTHQLNFNGLGPYVYNPSTYSYLLTPTTGWSPTKGQTMSNFVNYALTLGQKAAPAIGYASLGLSLEQYGVNAVTTNVPGSVRPTAAELAAYSCGDLTPSEVQAGQRSPTCGVTNQTAAPPPPNGGTASGKTVSSGGGTAGSTAHTAASGSSAVGGSVGGVNPFISLSAPNGLPNTGGNPLPLTIVGSALVFIGWIGRRRVLNRRLELRE
jgi:phosphate transport system substrate-binding protein